MIPENKRALTNKEKSWNIKQIARSYKILVLFFHYVNINKSVKIFDLNTYAELICKHTVSVMVAVRFEWFSEYYF